MIRARTQNPGRAAGHCVGLQEKSYPSIFVWRTDHERELSLIAGGGIDLLAAIGKISIGSERRSRRGSGTPCRTAEADRAFARRHCKSWHLFAGTRTLAPAGSN